MWTDNASDIDLLFYKPYADIISEDAVSLGKDPLTIGVFGIWGAGKSTLLKLIEKEYEETETVLCININAWMFEGYEDTKIAIMETLLKEIEEQIADSNIKNGFKKLIKRIDYFKLGTKIIPYAVPAVASIVSGTPLPLLLTLPNDVKDIGNTLRSISEKIQYAREEYLQDDTILNENSVVNNIRMFRAEFEKQIELTKYYRIVVLLDDLDRCQPEHIIEILEAIKLFLSVNKVTFIIAADENVIQYSIKKKYPQMEGFKFELDKEYIEKLIQLPITVPELSEKDIQNYLTILVYQKFLKLDDFSKFIEQIQKKKLLISEDVISIESFEEILETNHIEINERENFDKMLDVVIGIRDIVATTLNGNPRQAKRFLNTFVTKNRLAEIYYPGEIDPKVLAKLLVLYKLDHTLFYELNAWNKEFDTENKRFREMREGIEQEKDSNKYLKWYTPKIIKSVNCNPVELEKMSLNKYFYLTREILGSSVDTNLKLSEQGRKLLEELGNSSQGTVPIILKRINELPENEITEILNIIIKKIRTGDIKSYIYGSIYEEFPQYREDIESALKQGAFEITVSDLPIWMKMYNISKDSISPILESFVKQNKLKENLYDRIRGIKTN
mgnify:FL=1